MTQCERILRHLREVGPLSGAQAMYEYGIAHLASRISELRAAGYLIRDKMVHAKNRYGEKIAYKIYYLEDENGKEEAPQQSEAPLLAV